MIKSLHESHQNAFISRLFFVPTFLKLLDKITFFLLFIIKTEVSANLSYFFDHFIETIFARNMEAVDIVVIFVLEHWKLDIFFNDIEFLLVDNLGFWI
jgi:hypothetical protein